MFQLSSSLFHGQTYTWLGRLFIFLLLFFFPLIISVYDNDACEASSHHLHQQRPNKPYPASRPRKRPSCPVTTATAFCAPSHARLMVRLVGYVVALPLISIFIPPVPHRLTTSYAADIDEGRARVPLLAFGASHVPSLVHTGLRNSIDRACEGGGGCTITLKSSTSNGFLSWRICWMFKVLNGTFLVLFLSFLSGIFSMSPLLCIYVTICFLRLCSH